MTCSAKSLRTDHNLRPSNRLYEDSKNLMEPVLLPNRDDYDEYSRVENSTFRCSLFLGIYSQEARDALPKALWKVNYHRRSLLLEFRVTLTAPLA